MIWLLPHPLLPSSPISKLERQQKRKTENERQADGRGEGRGCGRSQIIRGLESLVLYGISHSVVLGICLYKYGFSVKYRRIRLSRTTVFLLTYALVV
jgi:hypothetical protein